MGGGSSKAYRLPADLPDRKLLKPVHHYYGKCKPASPEGKDLGLSEVYEDWIFPVSDAKRAVLLPRWRAFKFAGMTLYWAWDAYSMANNAWDENPKVQKLITRDQFTKLVNNMNAVLKNCSPREQRCEDLMVKVISQIAQETSPDLTLVMHIHKYAGDLAGDAIIEHVFFTIDMIYGTVPPKNSAASAAAAGGSPVAPTITANSDAGPTLAAVS